MLSGIVIQPGEVFSQNGKIGPYTQDRGFKKGPTYIGTKLTTTIGGGVCKIASTLYNVTILSNLKIVERSAHSMPVPYVPYGQDATVAYGARDFKFKNDTEHPVLIWSQGIENTLYMAFYGFAESPKVNWHHEVLKIYKAGKTYTTNPELQPGEERLLMEGMDGAAIKSWVTIEGTDGTIVTKKLQDSYYNPMPHLFEKGR
jgi:vancomycin resistance protein YoaR